MRMHATPVASRACSSVNADVVKANVGISDVDVLDVHPVNLGQVANTTLVTGKCAERDCDLVPLVIRPR